MKRVSILVLALITGCAVPQTSETKVDSVATLSEDTLQMADQIPPADTVFVPVTLQKKVKKAVTDPKTGYVYSDTGLDVYIENKVIGNIAYKAKVTIKNKVDDLYVIDFNGVEATIDSEFVLPLPVPETQDVVEYFTNTLMLKKDPIERRSKEDDQEGSFSFINYEFEGGFRVKTGSQYESGFTTVVLPGLTMEQAFLFASLFYESFDKIQSFPTEAREEDISEEKHLSVSVKDGKVNSINVTNGEGCYMEDSIMISEDGKSIVMDSSGGC